MLPKPTPDYRELLKRYMKHVAECEGVTLLNKETMENHLSDHDLAELQRLDYENE